MSPGRRQSETLLTSDERGSKIDRNSVFDCHLSPIGRFRLEPSLLYSFMSIYGIFDDINEKYMYPNLSF